MGQDFGRLTGQSCVDRLDGQVPELRPEWLQVLHRHEREVPEVDDLNGQGAGVDLRVDLDPVPESVRVEGGVEAVLREVLVGEGLVPGRVAVEVLHRGHQPLQLSRLLIGLDLKIRVF